jgi:hypothetical protein
MRRGVAVVALVVVILTAIGIGVSAYHAGEQNGIAQGIEQVQVAQSKGQDVQVVHVVGEDRPFFFPGFFLFPLFVFGFIFLFAGIARGRWGGPRRGPGPWNEDGRRRFEERAREWHQKEHADQQQTLGGSDSPAGAA